MGESMSDETLTEVYRRYLDCLNERRWDDLGLFVCEDAIHNSRPLGLSGYRAMLESDTAAIPDLEFVAEMIVAEGDTLASRLVFDCTPQRPFLGFEPPGIQIVFAEHAFYRFRGVKIAEVWSVIDTQAIEAQITH
jgi:predicted ester cyclase